MLLCFLGKYKWSLTFDVLMHLLRPLFEAIMVTLANDLAHRAAMTTSQNYSIVIICHKLCTQLCTEN